MFFCRYGGTCRSSVASFFVWGGGGGARPPNVPTEDIITYIRERANRASASETYIFRSQNTSAHTISAVPLHYLWHGVV